MAQRGVWPRWFIHWGQRHGPLTPISKLSHFGRPGPDDTQLVRAFGTYTTDLYALADWLSAYHIETGAMEATGVYWVPLFETLEARGVKCCLISATSITRFPGRKSDVLDCQWIQTRHRYGLLADSFRPEADLIALRTLLRHRAQLVEHRSPHPLHMQKALLQMNLQLSQALSDVMGETGQRKAARPGFSLSPTTAPALAVS